MKKATIIVRQQDVAGAAATLRKLGVLHIEHKQLPAGEDIAAIQEDSALLNTALSLISQEEGPVKEPVAEQGEWKSASQHIIDLSRRIEQLGEFGRLLTAGISEWQEWGDFDPQKIKELSQKNIHIRLFRIPGKNINQLPHTVSVKKLFCKGGICNCVVVSRELLEIPFKETALPKMGLKQMQQRLAEDEMVITDLRKQLNAAARYRQGFLRVKKTLEKKLELEQAIKGMAREGEIAYLGGYIPFDAEDKLIALAKKEKWGFVISEPSEEDAVPTFIRNPRWVSIIAPVFKLLEIVPGYRELDVSFLFLIFFSIFFGILIGDAGYGAVYLLLAFLIQRKMKKKGKALAAGEFLLFYVLSFCAIIWGLLTGTFFGQEWFIKAGFKPLVPALNEAKNIQSFCFFLGALHLTIAHSWRALLKFPSLTALVDIGWAFVLWAVFFFSKFLILSQPLPPYAKWLLITGITLVIFFTNPQKNIFKCIGSGLGNLALSLMNNFTDVVSYVRLFAVGLAGVAIADTFNAMASGVGGSNIVGLLAGGFIIVAGHGLNLILGPMSVLVHGVRLNMLEFSGHANVTWSGFSYKPLKE